MPYTMFDKTLKWSALYNANDVAIIFTEVEKEGETTIMAWPCASVNGDIYCK
jgi:hypothetical protein